MKNLTSYQLKALSEFFNTVAAAWFSAGVISPLFIKPQSLLNIIVIIGIALVMTTSFLYVSLFLVKTLKI
ncbi:hypothetical protein A3J17_01895 [Candidatus Curtissbacteria bacterium RIFCSPLOWO2_02_FULL_40_11]|uniref:Uncharacterized protein n=2 Tax=Candidatus Curtissiibacteriota TaxID=1752717 RepID=A0A1F5GAW9_9BACT|nr:MAG: hypothetical protein A2775_02845 [Candidatus Curtissbacteria bacterium RIFCSPHIGHO2_01_FULL_39_57]OGD88989.1 MAG: hypothetical protein A3D04_01425 [Candidatus Curtissbacteria bacterium RIFCSPHIGHO2_02_FULL_40_16b]OGD99874.1 MAG: hypothetical protein A3J17_01895 [Candidatus Curtissbacteria bacterium RIFCSPLOWO2_02_FULL_40_11]OGE12384.1 MAG: hypothetical protein A3G14_04645 [Candidatus Curtissbacteria bacterium RIFCSPLOWO2_12_FULL_38_9]